MATKDGTANRLRAIVHYDPESGVFTRRVRTSNRIKIGDIAGCVSDAKCKRVVFYFGGKLHYAHRLAWLYMTGKWPANEIDHVDGNALNNRFANLRDVQKSWNLQNMKGPSKNNTTGFLGVSHNGHKFSARITVNRKYIHLGTFTTPAEAHAAYLRAKRKYHAGCTI